MLYEAAGPEPGEPDPGLEVVVSTGVAARYLEDWGRRGDAALIAEEKAQPLGAAWYRLFAADQPGWGFIDEHIPEVALAVVEEHRGRGVGRALMNALIERATVDGFPALSLSTLEADGAGFRLYQSLGFRKTGEFQDPGGMNLAVMRLDLRPY